jgi:hypothetical protein
LTATIEDNVELGGASRASGDRPQQASPV